MKKITHFLLMMIVPFLFITCQDTNSELEGAINDGGLKSATLNHHEVPFEVEFQSHGADDQFASLCDTPVSQTDFWALDHQIGEGNAVFLGKFTFDMTFCFHFVLDENNLPDFDSGFGEVKDGDGYFETVNGDKLFISAPVSRVLLPDNSTVAYFDDTFYFNGGTGRFEGAEGEFRARGSIPSGGLPQHTWEGTLILPNANKAMN